MPSEVEPTGLAEWPAQEQDLHEDIRLSLDAHYPAESEEEPKPEAPRFSGIRIALAAFVPTFLVVFFGLSYLLAPPAAPPATPISAPPSATTLPVSLTPTGILSPSAIGPMDRWTAQPDPLEVGTWQPRAPALVSRSKGSAEPKPETIAPRPVSWVRAAAFAEERSASQLAATMRRQGYRVDLRQESSAPLPWVVWISQSPPSSRSPK